MLVLSRKVNQSITIGDGIRVTVVEIRGDKVRLGIEADRQVPVHRKEVWDVINHYAAVERDVLAETQKAAEEAIALDAQEQGPLPTEHDIGVEG